MSMHMRQANIVLRIILPIALVTPLAAQSVPISSDQPVIEFVRVSCFEECDKEITRVFADGRYIAESDLVERAKSGKRRLVTTQTEKLLEPGEVAELTQLIEQKDFIQAQPEYATVVQDQPSYVTITYRNGRREQKVMVANYYQLSAEEKAKIPPSAMKLLRWAYPYSFQ